MKWKWIRFWIITIVISFCGMMFALGCGDNPSNERTQTKQKVRVDNNATDAEIVKFEEWLLKNTAVIEVHFESDWQIWVRLSPEKYTNKYNVKQIAETIAKWYAQRMNKTRAICTVWNYSLTSVYVKGHYGF